MMLELAAVAALALVVLWLVLAPLVTGRGPVEFPDEPPPIEETRQGQTLLALKEIEFDHATGKLSDADYGSLKAKYTELALAALVPEDTDPAEALVAARRAALNGASLSGAPACPACGPRPERDARYCSACGRPIEPVPHA